MVIYNYEMLDTQLSNFYKFISNGQAEDVLYKMFELCKYCLSIPRNNRYGDIDYLCYIDGYFILSIYKDITKIKHYSPGGKVLDCKYKKIK